MGEFLCVWNGTLIKCVFMRCYFFFLQDKKRRRCSASTRLFNVVEWENSKQKNVTLLLNHSFSNFVEK